MYNIFTWYAHFLSVSVHYDPGALKTHHGLQKSEDCVKSIIQCIYKVILTIFLIQVHQLMILLEKWPISKVHPKWLCWQRTYHIVVGRIFKSYRYLVFCISEHAPFTLHRKALWSEPSIKIHHDLHKSEGALRNHLGHILSVSNHCYHLWSIWVGATKWYPKTRMAICNILNTVPQIKSYYSNTSYGVIKHRLNISTCQNARSWSLVR